MGYLVFTATEPAFGTEIWTSDGTASGTMLFKDITPDETSDLLGNPGGYLPFGSGFIFSMYLTGVGLSDGTSANTVFNGTPVNAQQFTRIGDKVYFSGLGDVFDGFEPWVSDGSAAGTFMLKNTDASSQNSFPTGFLPLGAKVYFFASSNQLWVTDGTMDGTVQVAVDLIRNISAPPVLFDGRIFFSGEIDGDGTGAELMVTDGTIPGTQMLVDINPTGASAPGQFTIAGDTLFFVATDGVHGRELWKTDGTAAGTTMVKDINPSGTTLFLSRMATSSDGTLYFTAKDDTHGFELWRSDGTEAGTVMVKDINEGALSGSASRITPVGDKVFFTATTPETGTELWVSDGAEAGTHLVKDIREGAASGLEGALPFAVLGGRVFFEATTDGDGKELWVSDGSEAGTVMLADINPGADGSNPTSLAVIGDARVSNGPDVAMLGPENDVFDGGEGDDSVDGGLGADTLVGGKGNDTLDGGANPEGATGQGDVMLGGEGDDTYHVDSGLDLVDEGFVFPGFGFGGFDTIISTTDFYWDTQSVGEVLRVSEDVNDVGGDGVTIVGGIFDNTLVGHSGTDVIFGRGGSDIYRAGDGIDFMSLSLLGLTDENAYLGVNGVNTVVVEQRASGPVSYDIVFEFDPGRDRIDVSDYAATNGLATGADVIARAVDDGHGNSYVPLGDGLDYLYMVGLEKAALMAGDFIV